MLSLFGHLIFALSYNPLAKRKIGRKERTMKTLAKKGETSAMEKNERATVTWSKRSQQSQAELGKKWRGGRG